MKFLTRWFIDNPVAANLLMMFILVAGWLTLETLRVESFPQISPTELTVSIDYPGGTASQVDQSITQRIEEAISGVAGIKSLVSESRSGNASVIVTKKTGKDIERLLEAIRNQVESIVGLPESAERPRIYRNEFTNLASFILIYGGDNDNLLQEVSTRVQRALKRSPEISQVTNLGRRSRELVIEPNIESLKRHGLNVVALATRVGQWSLEYRSGELRTSSGNIVLRGDSFADNLEKLRKLPIISSGGSTVRLGEIAEIRRDFERVDSIVRYQGEAAIALLVSTSSKDNLLRVSAAVKSELNALRAGLPSGIKIDVMADMAPYITEQINLLSSNALQGLIIVLVVLGLFLEFRLAFWVALGIPVSLAGAVLLMGLPIFDYSINDITLFGMILVLGVLVDDAVVVGESIHNARQHTVDPKQAAWEGVEAVAIPTVYGVLTTIAAFSPMLWIENELAKVLAGFSAVVIFALAFSLLESKFILPTHLSFPRRTITQKTNSMAKGMALIRQFCVGSLDHFASKIYQPLLKWTLVNRTTTLLLFCSFMLIAYGLIDKGHIRTVFFPEIPGRYVTATVTMDRDAPFELTRIAAARLEAAAVKAGHELQQEFGLTASAIEKYVVSVEGIGNIELDAELSSAALSRVPAQRVLEAMQLETGVLEGGYAVKFSLTDEPAGGTAISISSIDRELSQHVASLIKTDLRQQPGVDNVYDDSQSGRRQLQINLNDRGAQLGVDQRQLAMLVGGAFGDIEVHRLLENGEETRLLVRLPESSRKTIEQLKQTPVYLGQDSYVSLEQISHIEFTREPDVLYRRNRDEVVNLYWRHDKTVSSPQTVWQSLEASSLPQIRQLYPDVKIQAVGEFEEIVEVQLGFKKAMTLTLFLIYILLAIPLKSYWQPLVIMSVIPFGFAGAIYGHGLLGIPVSLLSMFGMMAMTGVVVNDSLVLMTRFNQLHSAGMAMKEALIEAGKSRMRPIFLTTVTTVAGLLPLLGETSEQAQYLKPAAVSLVFGELFATPITLILIPVLLSLGRHQKSQVPEKSITSSNVQFKPTTGSLE